MTKAQILIVEDDVIVAKDIEDRLKNLGYGIFGRETSGKKALEKVAGNPLDLVLMDIVLKGEMNRIEAAEIIRSHFGIPVIFLTAYANEKRLERAKFAMPFGYILKPFQDRDLKMTVEMALYIAKADAERKLAEKKLQESEEKFRNLFNNAEVGMFRTRLDGSEILDINEKCLDIFGRTREQMQGSPSAIHWADPSQRKEMVRRLELEGRETNFECGMLNKQGEVRTCLTSLRLYREQGLLEGSIIDITEQRKLETRLQQAQKMEAIGTLVGGIAHDFNNILFPIMGYSEMALDDAPKNSPLQDKLIEILQGTKRAGDLVKQILAFSHQTRQEPKPIMVQLIVKEALKLIRASLPSTIEIKQYISNQCSFVLADPIHIHQIAMNLMTNAFHAMEETGGKLEVNLKEVEFQIPNPKSKIDLLPGAYVCLTVADTGIGIEKIVMNRIFDPYFTTKENGKGTGLGLTVVHGIVKSYKGDIKVYSEPGKGTAFHVYLPVVKTEVESLEFRAASQIEKGTERILLVDDEDQIVRMEKLMLERLGYHVATRTSSIEALEAFRAAPNTFDLVITDMTMPNMTGVQLSEKMLEIRHDIPILICTGFSEKINDENAKLYGMRGFVMKPVIMSEIAKKIRNVLDEGD